jgi:hypothetical protein
MGDEGFDELPVVEEMPRGRRVAVDTGYGDRSRFDRRQALGFAFKAGVFVGLTMLGLFRSVRRAAADFPYRAHPSCGSYDPDIWNGFDGNDNGWFEPGTCAEDACVGVPPDAMGSWFCTTCAEVDAHNPYGWHFTGRRGPFLYGDQPDLCTVGGNVRDAWKWQVSSCLECEPAGFRCHDGWKLYPNGDVVLTVCQALVECSGEAYAPC